MIDRSKLVTKDYLKKFGDKSKIIFKHTPYHVNEGSGKWIVIKTSLRYNDQLEGFDRLYLLLSGISDGTDSSGKRVLNYSLYAETDSEYKLLDFAEGFNYGTDGVYATVFVKDSETGLLNICILLPGNRKVSDIIIDLIVSLGETVKQSVILSVVLCNSQEEPESENNYEQIAINSDLLPFDKETTIGTIIQPAWTETEFEVVLDYETIDGHQYVTESTSYSPGVQFDDIYHAKLSDELSHNFEFQYDWDNVISRDDDPRIIDSTFKLDEVVMLPVPNILQNGVTSEGWVNRVVVENGVVVDAENSSIPTASTEDLGGIYLGTDSTDNFSDKVWVLLDLEKRAFIDKYYFDQDKHRDDLNLSKYLDNIEDYKNQIWLHIGDTTSSFANGLFYKCVKTSYTVQYETENSPYYVGSLIGTRLESYILGTQSTLDLNKRFKLYVSSEDYPITKTNPDLTTSYVKIAELDKFKLTNINDEDVPVGDVIELTKELLQSVLDITVKTTDGWDDALTKDYNVSVMSFIFELYSTSYAWKQWDVLPRDGVGSAILYVTNPEIDYLFETHVTSITLSDNSLECGVGDIEQISVTIMPEDASNKSVIWTSSDPTIAAVTPTGEVHCVSEGYCIITCTSVSENDKYDLCEINVVPQNQ